MIRDKLETLKKYLIQNDSNVGNNVTLTMFEHSENIIELEFKYNKENLPVYIKIVSFIDAINDIPIFTSNKYKQIFDIVNYIIENLKSIKSDKVDRINIDMLAHTGFNDTVYINNKLWYVYTEEFKNINVLSRNQIDNIDIGNNDLIQDILLIELINDNIRYGNIINKSLILAFSPLNGSSLAQIQISFNPTV